MILRAALIGIFILTGCTQSGGNPQHYLSMHGIPTPTKERFTHCYNYGCQTRTEVSVPATTQKKLKKLFRKAPRNEAQEKERIRKAIQIFEQDIGVQAGTAQDRRGTFRQYEYDPVTGAQQDCVDESTNTTLYLMLLDQMDHLTFYAPSFPISRQPFLGGAPWWHQTATIKHLESGERFAIDSWFRDNGEKPFIVPLQEWREGWMAPPLKPPQK